MVEGYAFETKHRGTLRKRALAAGLPRMDAWVLAILGYWQQFEGGKVFGDGKCWRWREYGEIADDIGVCIKTISRAVRSLKNSGFVAVRSSWNPRKAGRVNFFLVTDAGLDLLGLGGSKNVECPSASDKESLSKGSDGPSVNGQNVLPTNTSLSINIKNEQASSFQSEAIFKNNSLKSNGKKAQKEVPPDFCPSADPLEKMATMEELMKAWPEFAS